MTSAVSGLSAALFRDESEEYLCTALGSNRDICFVSKNGTTPSIEIAVSGLGTSLSVAVAGSDVVVHSATDGSGVATSTAAQIMAAVNASVAAFALWKARLPPGQTGAGVTGALAHTHPYDGVLFTDLALVDSGDHKTYQAASGYRYWDEDETLSVEVDGSAVTTGFSVNYLRGSVTFDASQGSSTVTASGTRRSELAFQKVMGLFDGKLKIDGKEIDTTSVDDDGWGSSIAGAKSWELSAGTFYYDGGIPITDIAAESFWKFYSVLSSDPFAIGMGTVMGLEHVLANPNEAQKQTVTVKGKGEIYPE